MGTGDAIARVVAKRKQGRVPDPYEEDQPFVTRVGPVTVDWPRSIGFFGGLALAVAYELVAPELALFVAVVPFLKLLKRRHASRPERAVAAVLEGAAKPVGGDAESTIKPT
jgi:hypothetical protein